MDHLFFTISFTYDIKETSIQVDLCATIEMIDNNACIVRDIRRIDTKEPPLLPVLKLNKTEGDWVLADTGKESVIGSTIGEAIDRHLTGLSKSRNELKNK